MTVTFIGAAHLAKRLASIPDQLAIRHPALMRGMVWCRACGRVQGVDVPQAFRTGWPLCCDATMTIDPPARPTGAQLVAELRIAADRRGLTLWKFAAGISERPGAWLKMLAGRARPLPTTIKRVRAFIDAGVSS